MCIFHESDSDCRLALGMERGPLRPPTRMNLSAFGIGTLYRGIHMNKRMRSNRVLALSLMIPNHLQGRARRPPRACAGPHSRIIRPLQLTQRQTRWTGMRYMSLWSRRIVTARSHIHQAPLAIGYLSIGPQASAEPCGRGFGNSDCTGPGRVRRWSDRAALERRQGHASCKLPMVAC